MLYDVGAGRVDVVVDGDEFEANVEDGSGREVGRRMDVDFAGGCQALLLFEIDVAVGSDFVFAVRFDPEARLFDFGVDVDFDINGDLV